MFFEADLRDKHFKIDITESRQSWVIKLQEESCEWVNYEISKADYMLVEIVISLIFWWWFLCARCYWRRHRLYGLHSRRLSPSENL